MNQETKTIGTYKINKKVKLSSFSEKVNMPATKVDVHPFKEKEF